MLNDEKLKSNSKDLFMLSFTIHNSSFIASMQSIPGQKFFYSVQG